MRPIYGILGSILLLGAAIDMTVRMVRYRRMCSCTWRAVMLDSNSSVPMIVGLVGKERAGTGEPIVIIRTKRGRTKKDDENQPWRVRREEDPDRVASAFFDWKCHERTGSDIVADAYYEQLGDGEPVKTACAPVRWWKFNRTSKDGEATQGQVRLRR